MYELTISGWFVADHQLDMPAAGLEPLHGHDWKVAVSVAGEHLSSADMLVDFDVLKDRLQALLATLQGQNLNDLADFDGCNPSAERVAEHIAAGMASGLPAGVRLAWVEVEEAPGCLARFRPSSKTD